MPTQLPPLAPQFRPLAATGTNAAAAAAGTAEDDAGDRAQLSDGEYRTVLAAQRTLLAFLRTALAVLVVFRDSPFGPVLASLVALMGIVQFATAAPLYLTAAWRVPKPGGKGGRVDAHRLFQWTQAHAVLVCALVVVCVSIAIPWRFNRELEDGSAAQTAIEVFD
jgi:uncharacterized membrane protein YidH (DUF202 family)